MKVIMYMHDTCSLCDDASVLLNMLMSDYDFTIEERNIYTNDTWLEKYGLTVPVIEIADKQLMYPNLSLELIASVLEEQVNRKD